jgi:uncharacterized protein
MNRIILVISIILICILGGILIYSRVSKKSLPQNVGIKTKHVEAIPLSIEYMRTQKYPGSDITIEATLSAGINYDRYIASYKSDNLKIFALLTVPKEDPSSNSGLKKPATGWPVIIFNHGYIPPTEYRTTEKYIAYTDAFSRNGYIVFKSDYRGHGNSEGQPDYPEYSPAYTIDILNAISSIIKYQGADPNRIGMWGHSMGGSVTLRAAVVSKDIKAAEIWAGVVGTFKDLNENHHGSSSRPHPSISVSPGEPTRRPNGRTLLAQQYGDINTNPKFWQSIDPMSFLKDLTAPIQIQHGTADEEVPYILSQKLDSALKAANKPVEFYSYTGDDHNLSNNLNTALQRSVDFFDKYLKNTK